MKKILAMFLLCAGTVMSGMDTDLWKEYQAALDADRPRVQMEILDRIIREAEAGRDNWDFYDAWTKKVSAGSRINWKDHGRLTAERDSAFAAYGEPVIDLVCGKLDLQAVLDKAAALRKKTSRGFYENGALWTTRGSSIYGKALGKLVNNDYEFALWILLGKSEGSEAERIRSIIVQTAGVQSQQAAYAEFDALSGKADGLYQSIAARSALYESYSKRWAGSAASLLGAQMLLSLKMDTLQVDRTASSGDFRKLRQECADFESKRASFTGTGALLARECRLAKDLIETLDGRDVEAFADSACLYVVFRNMSETQLELSENDRRSKGVVYTGTVRNDKRSYYLKDTVAMPFPSRDDGDYTVKLICGDDVRDFNIRRHSISLAAVQDAQGYKLYAADYDSGRPLGKYDVALYQNRTDRLALSREGVCQEGGFALLPDEFASLLKTSATSKHYVVCSYTDSTGVFHSSGQVSFSGPLAIAGPPERRDEIKALLFTDCGAYHRKDVVHCKGILYKGIYAEDMAVVPKNTAAKLSLLNPDGDVVMSKQVKTNEFGSVMADFTLPSDIKGGECSIVLETDRRLSYATLRVDDFVLPDFYCEFDKIDSLYFAGDSLTVSGRVKSYNGHRVSVTSAWYELSWTGNREKFAVDGDGSFRLRIPAPTSPAWGERLTLVVNSASGSTLQFTRNIRAGRWLDMRVSLENETSASVEADAGQCFVLSSDRGIFNTEVLNADGVPQRIELTYSVCRGRQKIAEGKTFSGEKLELALEAEGEYDVSFNATVRDSHGEAISSCRTFRIIRFSPDSDSISADVENIFVERPEKGIAFDFAVGRGPVWAVVSLYGNEGECLYEGSLHLEGKATDKGTVAHFSLPFEESCPDIVTLRVFYFRNGRMYQWSREYMRPAAKREYHLEVSRFTDRAVPGTEYELALDAEPESEVAVSVFDKSSEAIRPNVWGIVSPYVRRSAPPYLAGVTGTMSGGGWIAVRSMALANEAVPFQKMDEDGVSGSAAGDAVPVRNDFTGVLCWQPQLKTSQDGKVSVSFRTSDKTGTFVLNAYAHNKAMENAVTRKEMIVSLPVELSVAEPVVLHEGDRYVMKAVVSALDADVVGTISLDAGELGSFSSKIEVGKSSFVSVQFVLDVPYGVARLPFVLTFTDREKHYSDALAFSVPVSPSIQAVTESHSRVLGGGDDREEALSSLRQAFVNTSAESALFEEISVSEILAGALTPHLPVGEKSVLGLSDAIATNLLYNHLTGGSAEVSEMTAALSEFINDDGGFAWIGGMSSSPIVTATVLERNARVRARTGKGFLNDDMLAAAVLYLDGRVTRGIPGKVQVWSPDVSLGTYLFVRSFYPEVKFAPASEDSGTAKQMKEFASSAQKYLFPSDVRSLPGSIFAKVLRLATLENLYALKDGENLLKGWNVGKQSTVDVLKSMREDIASLVEYAVPHRDGGIYFPNLVMPYRGLLSSEAYCHSLLCDLLAPYEPATADGIRLWLLLQKETQSWANDFSFTNAVASIMGGTEKLKNTSVMVLSKSYERPYREMAAAGNGFRISRHFVLTSTDGKQSVLKAGGSVSAGDKVTAVYRVWNAENRSFVRLTLPSYACLRPVNQLSANLGRTIRPLMYGSVSLSPQGYREVRSDKIEYYFDTFPEEDVEIRDEFFVTQTGTFTAPVVTVESLYAPHYRANGAFEGGINVQ